MSISCHPPLFSFSEDDILGFQSATRCNTVFVTLQMNNLDIFITAKTRSIICSPPYEDNEWIMPNFEEGIRLYAAMEIPVSIWISSVFFGIPRFGFTHGMRVGLINLLVRKFIPFLWSLLLYFVLCKYCLI